MIKKSFSYIGIFFLKFLSFLPLSLLYFFATLSYYPLYYVLRYRRLVVRENLINSFPEKRLKEIISIEKEFYRFLTTMAFEVIKMTNISKAELNKRVKFNNLDQVEQYYSRGQNVLACSAHYCNWELGMLALGVKLSATPYVIYKPVNNKVYGDWFHHLRTRFGNEFVPMRQTLRSLVATKNEATMFCFAGDQTPIRTEAKYWINFLNQPTPVLTGLEKIALQTDRPVLYFNMKYVRRGYYEVDCELVTEKPTETTGHQITDATFKFLENIIKENPPYWLWSHRRWKHKPNNEEWNQA